MGRFFIMPSGENFKLPLQLEGKVVSMQYVDTVTSADSMRGAKSQDYMPDRSVYSDQEQSGVDTKDVAADSVTAVNSQQSLLQGGMAKAKEHAEEKKELSEEELAEQKKKAKELSDKLNVQNIGLTFSVSDVTSDTVINVTNRSTEDLVRQIPSEDLIRFQKMISDFEEKTKNAPAQKLGGMDVKNALKGLILDETV